MKRILILTTGGTIACTKTDMGYTPTLDGSQLLSYIDEDLSFMDIQVKTVLNKDSTNVTPEDWMTLADVIYENRRDFDGMVVLHGTDTMAYTASAISFMTIGADFPIVFTGSQIPIEQEGSDGRKNLRDAIHTAAFSGAKGVFVVFQGDIINGCCATKADTHELDAFESVDGKLSGCIRKGLVVLENYPLRQNKMEYRWKRQVDNQILYLKIIPGMSAELLDLAVLKKSRAVILEAFGLGGIPVEGGFLEKIEELNQAGIPVIVTTQCSHGQCDMSVYQVGKEALKKGAVCTNIISKEALLTKIMWGLAETSDPEKLKKLLVEELCGEFGGR